MENVAERRGEMRVFYWAKCRAIAGIAYNEHSAPWILLGELVARCLGRCQEDCGSRLVWEAL
jgi:hypothetical protein